MGFSSKIPEVIHFYLLRKRYPTKSLASTQDCQGHGKKEDLETVTNQKTEEIRLNAVWYPRLDPGAEKGH